MSAYLTKLEIPGFNGSPASVWTQKINTLELGGGGGEGSMGCFEIDTAMEGNPHFGFSGFSRIETAELQSGQIRFNLDISLNGGWPVEAHYLMLTVKPEYEGLFPESLVFRFTSQYNTTEALYLEDTVGVYVSDESEQLGGWGYFQEYDPYALLDSDDYEGAFGKGVIPLTYPEGSTGLRSIVFHRYSGVPA